MAAQHREPWLHVPRGRTQRLLLSPSFVVSPTDPNKGKPELRPTHRKEAPLCRRPTPQPAAPIKRAPRPALIYPPPRPPARSTATAHLIKREGAKNRSLRSIHLPSYAFFSVCRGEGDDLLPLVLLLPLELRFLRPFQSPCCIILYISGAFICGYITYVLCFDLAIRVEFTL